MYILNKFKGWSASNIDFTPSLLHLYVNVKIALRALTYTLFINRDPLSPNSAIFMIMMALLY